MERRSQIVSNERDQIKEGWCYVNPGSVYAAEVLPDANILIGGSMWDRRNTPFNSETRSSPGKLTLLSQNGNSYWEQKREVLPSMVNAIVPLESGVFVGCKRGERAFNLFDQELGLSKTLNDEAGDGVYNAVQHRQTQSVLVATRRGLLVSLDGETLSTRRQINLNGDNARLWSLSVREDGLVVTGDYSGRLHLIENGLESARSYDMRDFLDESLPENQQIWEPSVFGATTNASGQIIASIRWGQITWFNFDDRKLKVDRSLVIPEEISQVASVPGTENLLIGTRSGRVLYYRQNSTSECNLTELLKIPPSFQTDNSVWSISCQQNNALVAFSDGQVVSLNIENQKGGVS